MKKRVLVSLAVLALISTGAAQAAGNVNFLLGQRELDDDVWGSDFESQPAFGVQADFGGSQWPVLMAVGLHLSGQSEDYGYGDVTVAVAEISFGANWLPLRKGAVRPYLGGGFESVGLAIDTPYDDTESDSSLGYYVNGGIYWRLGDHFNLGLDLRLLRGTDFDKFGVNANCTQYSLLLGFGW